MGSPVSPLADRSRRRSPVGHGGTAHKSAAAEVICRGHSDEVHSTQVTRGRGQQSRPL